MRKISPNKQELRLSWGLKQIFKIPPGLKTYLFEFCGSGRHPAPWGAAQSASSGCVAGTRSKLPSALGAGRAPSAPLSHTGPWEQTELPHGQSQTTAVSADTPVPAGRYPSDFSDTVSLDLK